MAVSKLWSVTSRLGQVIDYAANPEKTAADIYTEEQYQALHDVLSYAKDEEKTEREFAAVCTFVFAMIKILSRELIQLTSLFDMFYLDYTLQ